MFEEERKGMVFSKKMKGKKGGKKEHMVKGRKSKKGFLIEKKERKKGKRGG